MDKAVSDTIRNMRFPLIAMVVLLHTYIIDEVMLGRVYVPKGMYPHFDTTVYALKACFGEVAVPLFFLISGYLFFISIDKFVFGVYKNKLKKRVKSLLIPYLCWNSLFILFVFVLQVIHPEWMGEKKMVEDFKFYDWIDAYWDLNNGLIPLWYVRDLMVISLLTPIIYYAIKKTGLLLPLMLGALYLMNEFKYMPGVGTRCSFLFVLGAYFAIKNINFFAWANRHLTILLVSYISLAFVDTYCRSMGLGWLNQWTLLLGVFALSATFYRLTVKHNLRVPNILVESSFFIFVFHMFIIYALGKFWPAIIPVNAATIYMMQILIPITVSFACMSVFWMGKKTMPKITAIMVGAR